jgi:hypothetical protein
MRYSRDMHRIVIASAVLVACAPERTAPVAPDWAQGAPAVVQAQVAVGWEPLDLEDSVSKAAQQLFQK